MSTTVDLGKITASVTVGTTTTGAAGTNASVSNSGTTQDAVLNFTIPRGAQGVQGPQGSTGPQGPAGPTGPQGPMGDTVTATDYTLYNVQGSDSQGAMSQDATTKAISAQTGYYTCGTAEGTAEKVVTVESGNLYKRTLGGHFKVKMTNANTAASGVTLQVGSETATTLWYNGAAVSASNTWEDGEVISVYYDGTYYQASNAQGGGGKAEKIKYDNTQSGLTAENVQEAIDGVNANTILESDITNSLSSYESRGGYITASLGWTTNTNCNTVFIPCVKGDSFKLLCTTVNYYAILSAIPNTAATGFGSSRKTLSASSTPHIINITQDNATYLAIRADGSSGNTFAPAQIIKIKPLKDSVAKNEEDIENINNNIYATKNVVLPSPITLRGWIDQNNVWADRSKTYFSIVPVKAGQKMHWTYSGDAFFYAWLTDFEYIGQRAVTSGGTPSYAGGMTSRGHYTLVDEDVVVPSDANYLYVMHSYGALCNRMPTMYWIDSVKDIDIYARLRGKKVSILGDSISSYIRTPYNGANYGYAYPNFDYGIISPNQTWWGRLIDKTGMSLLRAAGFAGSKCSGNAISTTDAYAGCSTKRINDLSDGVSAPDIVFVFIGINDWIDKNHQITLGTFNPRSLVPAESDGVWVFADAYMIMLSKIMATYPKARIFCCTLMPTAHDTHDVDQQYPDINWRGVSVYEFNQVIREIADGMGVDVIELSRCGLNFNNLSYYADYDLIHPNSLGMELVANKAEAELLAKY